MKAHLRKIRISPKKVNLVAELIRKKKVEIALDYLSFMPKKAAKLLYKVLKSAMSNATNNDKSESDKLYISSIVVNKGPVYKRFLPSTRGRALPLHKPTAHISIFLSKQSS